MLARYYQYLSYSDEFFGNCCNDAININPLLLRGFQDFLSDLPILFPAWLLDEQYAWLFYLVNYEKLRHHPEFYGVCHPGSECDALIFYHCMDSFFFLYTI